MVSYSSILASFLILVAILLIGGCAAGQDVPSPNIGPTVEAQANATLASATAIPDPTRQLPDTNVVTPTLTVSAPTTVPTPSSQSGPELLTQTPAPTPTATPRPTSTPTLTLTPAPTASPRPTSTPTPTTVPAADLTVVLEPQSDFAVPNEELTIRFEVTNHGGLPATETSLWFSVEYPSNQGTIRLPSGPCEELTCDLGVIKGNDSVTGFLTVLPELGSAPGVVIDATVNWRTRAPGAEQRRVNTAIAWRNDQPGDIIWNAQAKEYSLSGQAILAVSADALFGIIGEALYAVCKEDGQFLWSKYRYDKDLNQSQGGMCISGVLKTTEMTPRPLASPLGPKRVGTERPV